LNLPIAKAQVEKHNAHLANFDLTSLRGTASARTEEPDIQVIWIEHNGKKHLASRRCQTNEMFDARM
jgi:hypothetical protein